MLRLSLIIALTTVALVGGNRVWAATTANSSASAGGVTAQATAVAGKEASASTSSGSEVNATTFTSTSTSRIGSSSAGPPKKIDPSTQKSNSSTVLVPNSPQAEPQSSVQVSNDQLALATSVSESVSARQTDLEHSQSDLSNRIHRLTVAISFVGAMVLILTAGIIILILERPHPRRSRLTDIPPLN